MFAFTIRRVSQGVLVMLIISFIGFAIKHNFGDPVRELVGERVTPEERSRIREQLGLNDPFLVQYGRFLNAACHGDLGRSFFFKKPVTEVIAQKAPATLELVFCASLIVICLSVPLGIYSAINPKKVLSRIIMGGSIIGVSMPVFLTAILLIYIFSVELGWLPSFGRGETVTLFGFWESGLLTRDGLRSAYPGRIAASHYAVYCPFVYHAAPFYSPYTL